jgi:hypothetical protein
MLHRAANSRHFSGTLLYTSVLSITLNRDRLNRGRCRGRRAVNDRRPLVVHAFDEASYTGFSVVGANSIANGLRQRAGQRMPIGGGAEPNQKPVPKPFRTPRTMPARPLLAQPHSLRARFMYRSKTLCRATRLFLSWQTRMRLFWLLVSEG